MRYTWTLDRSKYLTPDQVKRLMSHCTAQAESDQLHGRKGSVRAWMFIHLAVGSGLRVSELADVRCGDCHVGYGESHVHVRCGKGGKSGNVIIGAELKKHLKAFLAQKKAWGEAVGEDDHLLTPLDGQGYTRSALQKAFKTICRECGLPSYLSIHALRHTFCTRLLAETKNLRLVQKQARHASIATTTVYADVQDEEIQAAMDKVG